MPPPTTVLGNWYATALFWKPQLALLVNEQTLLPVLMPLAPASTLSARFPGELVAVLGRHGVNRATIERETAAMADLAFLAQGYREYLGTADLATLSMRLADTPCSPIKYNSPARLIKEFFGDAVR